MICKFFPIINKYTLKKINIQKYPWGWVSQKQIKKIIATSEKNKYQENNFSKEINEKMKFDENEFTKGSIKAYNVIYNHFLMKNNFLNVTYTTPTLSNALNYITKKSSKINPLCLQELESKVLTSWVEIGVANTNNHIMGKIDLELVKKELKNSNICDCWDIYVGPLKQKVKVLYKNKNRYDVWEWEKCLMKDQEEWTVSNINNILI